MNKEKAKQLLDSMRRRILKQWKENGGDDCFYADMLRHTVDLYYECGIFKLTGEK